MSASLRHSIDRRAARMWLAGATAAFVVGSAACSLLLDRSSTQCQVDADCAHFGGRPSCQAGICVDLRQGPKDCFFGTPSHPADFANQCSSAACLSFDDCARLGVCGDAAGPALVPPPDAGAGATTSSEGGDAGAAADLPSCADADAGRGSVIYITGSSNFPPLLAQVAPLLVAGGFTPVFQITSSCAGVRSVLGSRASDHLIEDPKGADTKKYAQFYDATGKGTPCSLEGPQVVDIGESDVFSEDCDGFGPAQTYGGALEAFGPIQAMIFLVNQHSNEAAISEEAAREVFGAGGNHDPNIPWTNPALMFIRNQSTGTAQMIGHAIDVPAQDFWGVDTGTAQSMAEALKGLGGTEAAQAIGIISVDYYDADRGNVRALAYRANGQECAYLPDSDGLSYDKRNVRDGHYPIWGPVHFFYAKPPSAQAAALLDVFADNTDKPVIDAFIGASLVPACAMSVQRDSELGPLSSTPAAESCECYFEAQSAALHSATPSLPAGCQPCGDGMPACPSNRPTCNLGYCEPPQ